MEVYETQTFDAILQMMLDRVPSDADKREGSIIYDALAPAAAELAQMYAELDTNMNLSFADTSSGQYLERRAMEFGITRKAATKAKRKGIFFDNQDQPLDVPLKSRFSISGLNYTVIERVDTGVFSLECETAGTIGNQHFGTLLPIDYIAGLARAELADVLVPGTDTEVDDSLRQRLLDKVRMPATSGNIAHYRMWAREIAGIRDARIVPLWNGPGTVKVVLLDTDGRSPTSGKVDEVREYIESLRPIGADVTYVACAELAVNIEATLILRPGTDIESVRTEYISQLTQIFSSTAFVSDTVRYSRLAALFLDIPGVIDLTNLTVNGGTANIPLADDEVAIVGTVTLHAA